MSCPSCSSPVPAGARFCPACGHELARRADERRIVTVLFADIVGFTALSETLDPEQVKNLVDRCFARLADDITAFGGRVDKVLGDAIIALFGAPVAHEDDAERAVRAALRMQETVDEFDGGHGAIQLRIGINTGEVLVGGLAAGGDYTAMGDVVNVAARLQAAAEPGTVVVGPETHEETCWVIRYGPSEFCDVRGRDEPVATWEAFEPIGRPGKRHDDAPARLVGRDHELSLLRRALSSAFRRNRGHLLLIQGETGVGKSRLADELLELARAEHQATILTGRCLPYGEANVWWMIAEAVRSLIDLDVGATLEEARAVVSEVVNATVESTGDIGPEPTVDGVLRMLGHPTRLDDLEPARADGAAALAVRALLLGLADQGPVAMWLADMHCADGSVLQFVDDTLTRLGRRPFVVIATGRPELAERWAHGPSGYNAMSVVLEPLDGASAERLLDDLLGVEADLELRREVLERAGGNPLFIHEMARMASADPDDLVVPGNVLGVVAARLDSLDPDVGALLVDAASLGLGGTVHALERMAAGARHAGDIDEPLERLVADGLLDLTDGRWEFRSTVVRDVAYSRLTKAERARRHAGIAAAVEAQSNPTPDLVAHHYRIASALDRELGGVGHLPDDLVDRAVDWTVRAARTMSGAHAGERIRAIYSEALDLLDDDDGRRAMLLLERARVELSELRLGSARRDISAAVPLVGGVDDVRLDVSLALVESELAQWDGDIALALEQSEAALVLIPEVEDPTLAGEALRRCGMVHLFLGREEEAETLISAALDAYEDGGDPTGMAWARQNLAWISYVRGRLLEAETRLDEAISSFEAMGDYAGIAWSRGLLAYVRLYEGRFAEADELASRTLADAEERGDTWGQGMMKIARGTAALWTGRVDEAVELAEDARSLLKDSTDMLGTIQATALLGRALARSGRVSEGLDLLSYQRIGDVDDVGTGEVLFTAAMAAAATVGDVDEGRRFTADHNLGLVDPTVLGHADRAVASSLIALQSGDLDTAVHLLSRLPGVEDPAGSTWAWAAVALTGVARGVDPGPYVDAVNGSVRATYGDRVLVRLADACRRAISGDDRATRAALTQAADAIPPGGDRIHPYIVASARAACLEKLEADDAGDAAIQARALASKIHFEATGWATAFATVLSS